MGSTTLVCALWRCGPDEPCRGGRPCCTQLANGKDERTPWGRRVRVRLVVAVEVGGRWSEEARSFLSQLAARSR